MTNSAPKVTVPKLATLEPAGLRPPDAAAFLGISERALWRIIADRTSGIPVVRFGKSVVLPAEPLKTWFHSKIGDPA